MSSDPKSNVSQNSLSESLDKEIDHLLELLPAIVAKLRALSPTWRAREAAATRSAKAAASSKQREQRTDGL